MKSDNNEQKRGGIPPLYVLEELLSPEDREYFGLCASNPDGESQNVRKEADAFFEECLTGISNAEAGKKQYLFILSEFRTLAEKYSESLRRGNTLWHTVSSDAERKKILLEFYLFCENVTAISEKLFEIADMSLVQIPSEDCAEKLEMLKKRAFICRLAGSETSDIITEKNNYLLEKILKLREEIFSRQMRTERAIGILLSSLDTALDVKIKGEKMDIAAAIRAVGAFISSIV